MDWLKLADIGANIFSKASGSAANNRSAKATAQIQRDQTGVQSQKAYDDALLERAKLEMDRKKLDADLQNNAWQKAMRSSLALNFTPMTRPDGVPNFGGPNLGAGGADAAKLAERAALLKLMEGGESYTPVPDATKYQLAPIPEASTWEKIQNLLGLGLTGASAWQHYDDGKGE